MVIDEHNTGKYTWGDQCLSFVLLENDGLSVKKERMPPETFERIHFHHYAQQLFYILKGSATFYVNEKTFTVRENQAIIIKPLEKHFVENGSGSLLEFLVISQPSTINDRNMINIQH